MIQLILFLNTFLVYIYTIFPTIAAYRDAGEFCCVGKILGIAHPPGYPLYTLLINIFWKILPFGNYAYKINIFSAISSSLVAVGFYKLYIFINEKIHKENNIKLYRMFVGYILSLIFAFGYLQWYLSLVSEMYALNTLFAFVLAYLCILYFFEKRGLIYLSFYIFGLGLTNRLDLVLFFPLLIFMFFDYIKHYKNKFKTFVLLSLLLFLGISCYLYLPIRSSKNPFIDWNDPERISSLWSSLTRKTHGYTLDLIAKGYKKGENFFDGLKLYFSYVYKNFAAIGIIFFVLGLVNSYKLNFKVFISLFLSWFLSCIYFIYTANMPPNPHSFAILEAHFLLPNIIVFVYFIFGIAFLTEKYKKYNKIIFLSLIFILVFNLYTNSYKLNKRNNFYVYDYTINLFRTIPKNSIVIIKEDVQLFSSWYRRFVDKFRQDINIFALGLLGSNWYKIMYLNYLDYYNLQNDLFFIKLDNESNWKEFLVNNSEFDIFITPDVEYKNVDSYKPIPYGFCYRVSCEQDVSFLKENRMFYDEIYVFRNSYIYDIKSDFFSSDIVEDYSKSLASIGYHYFANNLFEDAVRFYKKSISMNFINPYSFFELGYVYFSLGDFLKAKKIYFLAKEKFENYLRLAIKYKALSEVQQSIKYYTSICFLHLGVVEEKLKFLDNAIEYYNTAIKYNPNLADAYYNLAVVYWQRKEFDKVVQNLVQTLNLNPNHKEARLFLDRFKK